MPTAASLTAVHPIISSSISTTWASPELLNDVPEDVRRRYEITLQNAAEFFKVGASVGAGFTPMGVIQGWSADSMAQAACKLASMGYDYLAIGGTVPLKIDQLRRVLARPS